MTTYCNCDTPTMDVETESGCHRCGLPINLSPRSIVFEINGDRYEAPVDEAPVRREELTDGHLTVEHASESYAIYIEALGYRAGEYVARPIEEAVS